MKTTGTFAKTVQALALHPRYLDSEGGARSGKTFTNLQILALLASSDKTPTITSVVSENLPHLKKGAIRDFTDILTADNLWDDSSWSKTEYIYTFPNGSIMEFYGVDNASKVHGPARDRLFINEAQNVAWDAAQQLMMRTSGLIMWDYNPTHRFWAHEQFENEPRCAHVHSTFADNQYIPAEILEEILRLERTDPAKWRVYGKGLVGVYEGLIYPNFTQVDALPDPAGFTETYGVDFGFTNDPTAIIRCLIHRGRKEIWLDEITWQKGLQNPDIAAILKQQGLKKTSGPVVYADCAEPKSIAEINSYGINVKPCDKSAKIKEQIGFINGFRLYVTKRSVNLVKELRNYQWAKTTDGQWTNEPVDVWNHCFEAGTMVATPGGPVAIEMLRPGDLVLTSQGVKKVEKFFENGYRSILDISLNFSNFTVRVRATPDHKFKTTEGWKQLKNLKPGDVLYVLKNSTGKCTNSTPASAISHAGAAGCTGTYGSSITAQSRKGMTCTIRTGTRKITTYQTSPVSGRKTISRNTMMTLSPVVTALPASQTCVRRPMPQRSGINRKPGANGITSTQKRYLRDLRFVPASVKFAGVNSGTNRSTLLSFAAMPANRNGAAITTLMTSKRYVRFAERTLCQTNTAKMSLVETAVVQSIDGKSAGSVPVFDICVEDAHEFFANGVLVHNCCDAFRYGCYTPFANFASGYLIRI